MLKKTIFLWLVPMILLFVVFWFNLFLCYPRGDIGALQALEYVFFGDADEMPYVIVHDMRLPRVLVGLSLGACLALAGTLLQIMTRNPLASPSLLGINSGASLAVVIVIVSPAILSSYSIAFVAAAGGALSWLLVMTISSGWQFSSDRTRMILAGIAVSILCSALTKMTLILSEDNAFGIIHWLAGGISNAKWKEFWSLFPFLVAGVIISMILAKKLNLLSLSDESAQTLGINLFALRLTINIISLILVGACVSVAGPLAFIGLLIPHAARFLIGHDTVKVIPMSMILGAILMLSADLLSRYLAFPGEIPAGSVLALIGAPFFVWLARSKR